MNRVKLILILLIGLSPYLFAQEEPPPVPPAPPAAFTAPPARAAIQRRELTLRQRRELGLTVSNLVKVAKELREEGEISPDMSRAEKSAAIMVRLHDKNPQAFTASEVDWDAVLEFIERLMGLIEKIMGWLQ